MIALTVFGQLVSLFLIIFVGYALGKRGVLNDTTVKQMGMMVTKVFMPLALIYCMQVPYSRERLGVMGIVVAGMAIGVGGGCLICHLLCKLRRVPFREANVWVVCAGFANTTFIGKPILMKLYGEEILFATSATMFIFNICCFTLGASLIAAGSSGEKLTLKGVLKSLLFNGTILGAIVGFVLFAFSIALPTPVLDGLGMLNDVLSPIYMIIIGYSLAQLKVRELFNDYRVYLISALKLILNPIITFLVVRLFVRDIMMLHAICIAIAMPTANSVGVLCTQYDNHQALSAKVTFGSTILCIVTAPLFVLFMDVVNGIFPL